MAHCPGCGVSIPNEEEIDKKYNALVACVTLCGEASFYTLSLGDSYFIHQLLVDTYAAQHAGPIVKPISTAFALIGLYLIFEKNYTGREVQKAHMILAQKNKQWPHFILPSEKARLTVQDVVQAQDSEKQEMIKKWGKAVWDIWKAEHEQVINLTARYLF